MQKSDNSRKEQNTIFYDYSMGNLCFAANEWVGSFVTSLQKYVSFKRTVDLSMLLMSK